MKWFAAHAILTTRFKDGEQRFFPVTENVYLIAAATVEEARAKAAKRAIQSEGDSRGSYNYEGRPAILKFEGIRKLIECEESDRAPLDGDEITYSNYEVGNTEDLQKLVTGESVNLRYEE